MTRKILLINGHPDPSENRLAAALADAYARGAERSGHAVVRLNVGDLNFPMIITGEELDQPAPEAITSAQNAITWADHVVVVFPLWLGSPPAILKGFFEQICRYGFAFDKTATKGLLKGRSTRLIVTMIIPNIVFHLLFRAGVKAFERGIFWTSGFRPIRTLALGNVLAADKHRWLKKVEDMGARGA